MAAIPVPSATVVRAGAYHAAGGYHDDLRIRNDADFHLRLSLLGPWVHAAGNPVIYRRFVDETMGGAPQLTRALGSLEHNLVLWRILCRFLADTATKPASPWPRAAPWRVCSKTLRSACRTRASKLTQTNPCSSLWP